MVFQKTRKLWVWCAMAFVLVMFFGAFADAQLADLDLLEDDDRSFGASVTAMPVPNDRCVCGISLGDYVATVKYHSVAFRRWCWGLFHTVDRRRRNSNGTPVARPRWTPLGENRTPVLCRRALEARHRLCGLRAFR